MSLNFSAGVGQHPAHGGHQRVERMDLRQAMRRGWELVGGRWLLGVGWWLVVGGSWLVVGGSWLVVGGWWESSAEAPHRRGPTKPSHPSGLSCKRPQRLWNTPSSS